jgi:hypothetical protein
MRNSSPLESAGQLGQEPAFGADEDGYVSIWNAIAQVHPLDFGRDPIGFL